MGKAEVRHISPLSFNSVRIDRCNTKKRQCKVSAFSVWLPGKASRICHDLTMEARQRSPVPFRATVQGFRWYFQCGCGRGRFVRLRRSGFPSQEQKVVTELFQSIFSRWNGSQYYIVGSQGISRSIAWSDQHRCISWTSGSICLPFNRPNHFKLLTQV